MCRSRWHSLERDRSKITRPLLAKKQFLVDFFLAKTKWDRLENDFPPGVISLMLIEKENPSVLASRAAEEGWGQWGQWESWSPVSSDSMLSTETGLQINWINGHGSPFRSQFLFRIKNQWISVYEEREAYPINQADSNVKYSKRDRVLNVNLYVLNC